MKFILNTSRCISINNSRLLNVETFMYKNCRFIKNTPYLQIPEKEPTKSRPEASVPPCLSSNIDNTNNSSRSTEKKDVKLNNTQNEKNIIDSEQRLKDLKFLKENSFGIRLIDKIEKISPSAAKYARLGVFGCKYLYNDGQVLMSAYKKYFTSGLSSLTYKELELKYRLPVQLVRLTPILLCWPIPFTNFLLFPLAFIFPKYLLSEHFWTDEQQKQFWTQDQRKCYEHNVRIFEHLSLMAEECSDDMLLKWFRVIECLAAGGVSPVDDIQHAIPVFSMFPYHFSTLPRQHITVLLKLYNMHRGLRRRVRLKKLAQYIQLMDRAMEAEGGPVNLNDRQLQWACMFRGLYPFSSSRENLVSYLENWLKVSSKIDKNSLSCILHCQVLLALNRPENDILRKTD
ncbi:LETM1 domain-containing protein 1 [Adelges cooleyi]|uniref:LETM1 domain-containing protein 1 n=1 Tax=Adelges cooleyi TaxID=133065 RepID=UPI0021802690|nr:LETM1 domain-containing protein 1 [Adelges cooleyi]XP_050440468.1 LETM1 domain-containing protein 1 [Adelges cooleyi]